MVEHIVIAAMLVLLYNNKQQWAFRVGVVFMIAYAILLSVFLIKIAMKGVL